MAVLGAALGQSDEDLRVPGRPPGRAGVEPPVRPDGALPSRIQALGSSGERTSSASFVHALPLGARPAPRYRQRARGGERGPPDRRPLLTGAGAHVFVRSGGTTSGSGSGAAGVASRPIAIGGAPSV
jgi:hypothetical protein